MINYDQAMEDARTDHHTDQNPQQGDPNHCTRCGNPVNKELWCDDCIEFFNDEWLAINAIS